jgi:hypothetical protein
MQPTDFIGKRISQVRRATLPEMKKLGWEGEQPPVVFVLDNGYVLMPSRDAEMNQPGEVLILDALTGKVSAFQ